MPPTSSVRSTGYGAFPVAKSSSIFRPGTRSRSCSVRAKEELRRLHARALHARREREILDRPVQHQHVAFRPSLVLDEIGRRILHQLRQLPLATRSCVRPSTTVCPCGESLPRGADTSSSLDIVPRHRPSRPRRPSTICTALTPVSPPLRRSTMHCSASRPWKSITSALAVADHERALDFAVQRQLDIRQPPGHRQGRPGQHRKLQPPRRVDHPLGRARSCGTDACRCRSVTATPSFSKTSTHCFTKS